SAAATIFNAPLPIVNKSLAQILDVATEISHTLDDIANNPAAGIQKLNKVLANALNRLPSILGSTQTQGDGVTPELQRLKISNTNAGTFKLWYDTNSDAIQDANELSDSIA